MNLSKVYIKHEKTTLSNNAFDNTTITFGNFFNGINLFIRVSETGSAKLDLLDNPYFEVKAHIVETATKYMERKPTPSDKVKLIKCTEKELKKYFGG